MIDALHTFYQKSKQYSDIPNELFHKYNVKKDCVMMMVRGFASV